MASIDESLNHFHEPLHVGVQAARCAVAQATFDRGAGSRQGQRTDTGRGRFQRVRHAVENVLSGEYRSAFRGRGMEFDQVVRYSFGDDVRDTLPAGVTFVSAEASPRGRRRSKAFARRPDRMADRL